MFICTEYPTFETYQVILNNPKHTQAAPAPTTKTKSKALAEIRDASHYYSNFPIYRPESGRVITVSGGAHINQTAGRVVPTSGQ